MCDLYPDAGIAIVLLSNKAADGAQEIPARFVREDCRAGGAGGAEGAWRRCQPTAFVSRRSAAGSLSETWTVAGRLPAAAPLWFMSMLPLKLRAIRDADARREDVAFHFRRSADRHRFAGVDVAIDAAFDDHELGADVAGHAAILADRQAARVFDRTFQLALEFQVLFAVQLALEMQRRAEHAGAGCDFLLRRGRRGRHLVLEAFAHGFLRLSGSRRGWRILATQHSIPW